MSVESSSESSSDNSQPILGNALKSGSTNILAHTLSESCSSSSEDFIDDNIEVQPLAFKEVLLPAVKSRTKKAIQKKKHISKNLELKEWKEKLKLIKPENCLKYIRVSIEESLSGNPLFGEVIEIFISNEINWSLVKADQPTVTWLWQELSTEFCKKSHVVLIWQLEHFLSLARKHILIDFFINFIKNKPDHRVYLILHGSKGFFRDKEAKNEMDYYLCELEVNLGVGHQIFDTSYDLANFFWHMTKSVSQEPYRAEKEKLEQEKTFYLQGRSHNCVKIDKENNGMKNLWVQQVAAIQRLALDSAKVVCGNYPTPFALYEAYKKLTTVQDKNKMLQEIMGGREGIAKKLGPKMSGRLALLFATIKGDLGLSDWK